MAEQRDKHPHYVLSALRKVPKDGVVCAQVSNTEEAIEKGGGYLFFLNPSGRKFPTVSARYCIDKGLLINRGDALFGGISQSYEVRDSYA